MRQHRFHLFLSVVFGLFLCTSGSAQTTYNLVIVLSGGNQNPAVTTSAYGVGWARLDLNQHKLSYAVAYDSLSSGFSGAHFHLGAAGANGPVIHAITFDGKGVAVGEWTNIPDTTMAHILKGRVYCNIHTSAHPGGEIRGQLEYATPFTFTFLALPSNEIPALNDTGAVVGFATLAGGQLTVSGVFKGLSSAASAMHIHYGSATQSGGVAIPLTFVGSLVSGGGALPKDSTYRKLLNGEMYFNIHTSLHAGGEARGQLTGPAAYAFWATMSGTQSVPPNASLAQGVFLMRYVPSRGGFDYASQIVGIPNPTGAHIHAGAAGQNGGVMIPLTYGATGYAETKDNPVAAADSVFRLLCKSEAYVNAHTSTFPSGEIRGQIFAAAEPTTIAFLDSSEEVSVVNSSGTGASFFTFSSDHDMNFSLMVNGLTGAATAAHIHTGAPGVNGAVIFPLVIDTVNGLIANVSDSTMIQLLRGGNHYVNVHTALHPGGEIRGNIMAFDGSDNGGPTSVQVNTQGELPDIFALDQNFPNPFNPSTTIRFTVPAGQGNNTGFTTLKVYDIIGREITTLINGQLQAGTYTAKFDASRLSSGMYFYQLRSGSFVDTKKMLLMK